MCEKCKEIENKVFWEGLPRWQEGTYKGLIDWKKSIGEFVKFIYNGIEGEVEIIDYDSSHIFIKYLDNEPFRIYADNFKKCALGKLLGKVTKEFRFDIGECFKDDKRDLIIINREYRIRTNKNGHKTNYKFYEYKCNKCGWRQYVSEYDLLKGIGCTCTHIITSAPWMIPYFQGGIEEAKLYNCNSIKKILPICPDCGRVKDKEISILSIYKNKSIGCYCSDGKSYPEKLMFNILQQLNIDFETEYSPNWCSYKCKNKLCQGRYDFYFEIYNKKYIIETDGGLGHGNNIHSKSKLSKEESQFIDNEKDRLANEHDIEVIRINCIESDLEFIKNNILIKLNELFDLSNIDWNKAEEFALSNRIKEACELKKDDPDMTTSDISKKMKLCCDTIREYLKKGDIIGWCEYKPIEHKEKEVKIFKNNICLGIFKNCHILEKESEKIFGIKLLNSGISKNCSGKTKHYKGYTFKYIENSILKNLRQYELFELTDIEKNKLEEVVLDNTLKEVCRLWNDNKNTLDISNIMGLHQSTINRYLKKCAKLGLCNYNPKEETAKTYFKKGQTPVNIKQVEIFKDGISLGTFESVTELSRKSEQLFGIKLFQGCISSVCLGKQKTHKGYTFKYVN